MSEPLARATLEVPYALETSGGDVDIDQVMHWMAGLGEAIGELDPMERSVLVDVPRRMAAEAAARGDDDRADAYQRIADAESAG